MSPKNQKQTAIKRMPDIPVQSIDPQRIVFCLVGAADLRCARKPPPVVPEKCNRDDAKSGDRQRISRPAQRRRQSERRRVRQQGLSQPLDRRKVNHGEPVISKPVPWTERQAAFHAVRREHRVQEAERRPAGYVEDVIG